MTDPLDSESFTPSIPYPGLRQLHRVFILPDDRVDLIEAELDATRDGSLAATVHELRTEVADLRARLEGTA